LVGDVLYVSGQIGRGPDMQLVEPREAQIVQAFENLKRVLETAGGTLEDIVDLTTFHTDMRDLPLFIKVRNRYLTSARCQPGPPSAPTCWAGRLATSSRSRRWRICARRDRPDRRITARKTLGATNTRTHNNANPARQTTTEETHENPGSEPDHRWRAFHEIPLDGDVPVRIAADLRRL
jgi:enamine deaminase RidA (YjgF/YER057c/UK114 family)